MPRKSSTAPLIEAFNQSGNSPPAVEQGGLRFAASAAVRLAAPCVNHTGRLRAALFGGQSSRNVAPAKKVLTQKELAQRLGCSVRLIQKEEKLGVFPIPRLPRVGRKPLYSAHDVEKFERRELKPPTPQRAGRRGRR